MRWLGLVIATLAASASGQSYNVEGIDSGFQLVTCRSAVKLDHKASGYKLHSHSVNWGSGSGQQSVTMAPSHDDPNSLWIVAERHGAPQCIQGSPIKCGEIIRLQHANTKKYLHSHHHRSPLTQRQEVSGYTDPQGNSDEGDNWKVVCLEAQGEYWTRTTEVQLQHVATNKYLFARRNDEFNNQNCRGCPIVGQLEVSCHSPGRHEMNDATFRTGNGVYWADVTQKAASASNSDDEL